MAAGRPHTRALHQEESGGARRARRPRAPETASPSRSQILPRCVCVRADGGLPPLYHLEKKSSERSPLSDTTKPRSHITVHVRRTAEAGWCRKTRRRPRGREAANIKKG